MAAINGFSSEQVLSQLRDMQTQMHGLKKKSASETEESKGVSFAELLKGEFNDVNNSQKAADKMAVDLASGKSQNLHEAMIAATKAELNFNFLVQVRNKILEAYQEVMRMQV